MHLFARSKADTVESAIVEAIGQVRGAYSLVLMTKDRSSASATRTGSGRWRSGGSVTPG